MTAGAGVVALVLASLLALALAGCSRNGEAQEGKSREKRPVPVVVRKAERRDVPVEIRAIGTVEATATVSITAQVGGELVKVHFKEGDLVKKGDVLFTLDPRPFQVALSEAQATQARSEALAANARKELARAEELAKKEYLSQEELERASTNAAALEAAVRADRSAVQSAALNLQYATIRAPIDGRTGARLVDAGNVIKANDTRALVVIRQDKPIRVRFSVPEQHTARIRSRMKTGALPLEAMPRGHDGPPARGELTLIDNAVDSATGSIELRGQFPNDDELLWPGQYVDVVLGLDTESGAVVITRTAVLGSPGNAYAFVVKDDRTVEMRPVVVRRYVGDDAVLDRGLAPGESVVVDGQLQLVAGARVELKDPSKASAGPAGAASSGARPGSSPSAAPSSADAPK